MHSLKVETRGSRLAFFQCQRVTQPRHHRRAIPPQVTSSHCVPLSKSLGIVALGRGEFNPICSHLQTKGAGFLVDKVQRSHLRPCSERHFRSVSSRGYLDYPAATRCIRRSVPSTTQTRYPPYTFPVEYQTFAPILGCRFGYQTWI